MDSVCVQRVSQDAFLPTRAHKDDAGLDLYCLEDTCLPGASGKLVRTGIAVEIPQKHVGLVADRSSLAKKGLKVTGGIVDAGYRGEVHVVLWNLTAEDIQLKRSERVAQLLILPIVTPEVVEVSSLGSTQRGDKGFGSTGK